MADNTNTAVQDAPIIKGDNKIIKGPDGKWYKFNKDRDDKFIQGQFLKKGIKAPEAQKKSAFNPGPDPSKVKDSMMDKVKSAASSAGDYAVSSLPAIGGIVGGAVASPGVVTTVGGAALGGAAGQAAMQLVQRFAFNKGPATSAEAAKDIGVAAAKQGALEYVGQKTGDIVFGILNKLPHAKYIESIPFLPSEYKAGGKVYKYVEDLLSNLLPSTKVMEDFRKTQSSAVDKKLGQLVNGFAKFKGTSADMGELLQKTMQEATEQSWAAAVASGKAAGMTEKQFAKSAVKQEFMDQFRNSLAKHIVDTESPSLISGYIRNKSVGSEENIKYLVKTLEEKYPKVLAKTQSRLMRDFVSEAMKGSTDPVAKGVVKGAFTGESFKKVLDGVGEERLIALYGQDGYDSIENFVALTSRIGGGGGGGTGKFLNLMFLLPFRNGISLKSGTKLSATAFVTNRMAKIITSPEGMKLVESEIRATAMGATKAASLARDEIKKYNERSDEEYEQEKEEVEQRYMQDHPKFKPNK